MSTAGNGSGRGPTCICGACPKCKHRERIRAYRQRPGVREREAALSKQRDADPEVRELRAAKSAARARARKLERDKKLRKKISDAKYRARNAERIAAYMRDYNKQNVDRLLNQKRAYRYGLTLAELEQMLELQGRKCAICAGCIHLGAKGCCVDHCHESGAVRGLLCSPCNHALGNYERHQRRRGFVVQAYEVYLAAPPALHLTDTKVRAGDHSVLSVPTRTDKM